MPGRLPKPGRYLLWRDGSGQVQHCLIDRDLVIGRASDCDIVLDDPRVSRHHALIRHHFEANVIVDLRSNNGIMINGSHGTAPRILHDGDLLVCGRMFLLSHECDRGARS